MLIWAKVQEFYRAGFVDNVYLWAHILIATECALLMQPYYDAEFIIWTALKIAIIWEILEMIYYQIKYGCWYKPYETRLKALGDSFGDVVGATLFVILTVG